MSFKYKTIVGIAIIEAFMLSVLVWNALQILTYSNEKELIKRAHTTTQLFAAANTDAVLSNDLATLESLADEVLKHSGIIYVRVYDRDGRILTQKGDEYALIRTFKPDTTYVDVDDGIFDSFSAIKVSGVTYGHIEIGFAIDDIDAVLEEARQKSLTFAGIEMALTAVFSFILGIYLTRSINYLRKGAEKISAGNLGYQIKISGSDELASAAAAFNDMSSRLEQLESERKQFASERKKAETEIHRRVEELENFYDMAVGRELKMKELKKEVEELKSELSKYK